MSKQQNNSNIQEPQMVLSYLKNTCRHTVATFTNGGMFIYSGTRYLFGTHPHHTWGAIVLICLGLNAYGLSNYCDRVDENTSLKDSIATIRLENQKATPVQEESGCDITEEDNIYEQDTIYTD